MKLGDYTTKKAIREFLAEAQACAQHRKEDGFNILGYAAMLTTFSCVLAVGEMLEISRNPEKYNREISGDPEKYDREKRSWPSDEVSICEFYKEMQGVTDEQAWLVPPEGKSMKDFEPSGKPCKLLRDLRNALVHAISMSSCVAFVPSREAAQSENFNRRLCIIVPDFITAVERTFEHVADENPDVDWDPNPPPRTTRGLAQVIYPATDTGNSCGSIDASDVGRWGARWECKAARAADEAGGGAEFGEGGGLK